MPKFCHFNESIGYGKTRLSVLITGLVVSLVGTSSHSDDEPLLELGLGLGGLTSAHYPGSDQTYQYAVPVPYVVYRGERIKADRSGLTAKIADFERLELSLSANAGLPVDSSDNRAREGMPDLGWILEAGPLLRYIAYEDPSGTQLNLELPVRAAFSLEDADLRHRGWTLTPGIVLKQNFRDWKLTGSLRAMFGDRTYHGYFYDVEAPYVTESRPRFRAEEGYTGSRLGLAFSRQIGKWYYGGFLHYYSLQGGENSDSPLMRDRHNYTAGFMVSRILRTYGKAAKSD